MQSNDNHREGRGGTHTAVDSQKGAVLIGGLDETGLVPEGCVFVQIKPQRNNAKSAFEVLNGPVMVTKHPVMHPGDVRMLLAVDIPELKDHKNVILFSRHGDRPEADKMSGSDLDGDQFAVTWDDRLFLGEWNSVSQSSSRSWFAKSDRQTLKLRSDTMLEDSRTLQKANAEPMDFDPDTSTGAPVDDSKLNDVLEKVLAGIFGSKPKATEKQHPNYLQDELLLDHFIAHAKNDNVGIIATMWLDYANKYGATCQQCLELAALHSIAVDFPKSGRAAEIPKELFIRRIEARAHWREKKGSPSYDCTGPIGRMYDEVIRRMHDAASHEKSIALAGRKYDRHGQILRFVEKGWSSEYLETVYRPEIAFRLGFDFEAAMEETSSGEDLMVEAMDLRDEYEQALIGLMSKYGLQCEGEILTGCIRKYHKLDKRRQHDVSEAVKTQCRELRRYTRRKFFLFVLYTVCPHLIENEVDNQMETAWVVVVEAVATDKYDHQPLEHEFSENEIGSFKALARQLAAACYEITYNSEMWFEEGRKRSVLFSFPWIVADVIACGLRSDV